jgi:hypothetical protein
MWQGLQSSRTPGTFPSFLHLQRLSSFRRDTFELTQAKNPLYALIPLARSAFRVQTNSLVTLVYTTMTTLPLIFNIQHHLQKGPQKLRSIFQCQMNLLLLLFPVQETLDHPTIKRRLGRKKRQGAVLTVMTRYSFYLHSSSYTHIIFRTNLMLVQQQ